MKVLSKSEKLKHCQGCRNNFYNGNNPYEIKECWSLKNAVLQKRKIYYSVHQTTPTEVKTLNCFIPQR